MMSFGDPETAINANHITDYLGVFFNEEQEFYTPPISLLGLCQLLKANPLHGTLPYANANWALSDLVKNKLMSREKLRKFIVDYRTMGNAYLLFYYNLRGVIVQIDHLPAINMRKKPDGGYRLLQRNGDYINYQESQIFCLQDYDPMQQVYGIPYWFGGINAILLGEETDLFPRKFFKNGAHTGNLYATSDMLPAEEKAFKEILKGTKGPGNFRSIHVGGMKGDVDKKLKVIPIGEIGQKVEFTKLAEASDKRVLSAWRYRPELAGIMPGREEGSGDLDKIINLHKEYEVRPLQMDIAMVNDYLPHNSKIYFNNI